MAIVECSICGKKYELCNNAAQSKTKPWRVVVDTSDHYMIYLALHGYTVTKDKNKSREELQKCNLSDMDGFNPEIKAVIDEILQEDKIVPLIENEIKPDIKMETNLKVESKYKTKVKK